MPSQTYPAKTDKYAKVYAPISERFFGNVKEWEPIGILEIGPDCSEKMSRYSIPRIQLTEQQAGTNGKEKM